MKKRAKIFNFRLRIGSTMIYYRTAAICLESFFGVEITITVSSAEPSYDHSENWLSSQVTVPVDNVNRPFNFKSVVPAPAVPP